MTTMFRKSEDPWRPQWRDLFLLLGGFFWAQGLITGHYGGCALGTILALVGTLMQTND
jgi:hypothetical protein